MGILEIFAAAIETVGGLQVPRLHEMIDILDVYHELGVKVNVQVLLHIDTDAFDFLSQHGEVELGGVETGQVRILEPGDNLVHAVAEAGAAGEVLILDPVYGRCLRMDGILPLGRIVPRLEAPGLDTRFPTGQHLYKTQLTDTVRGNIQSRAFDVKKQQRSL